MVYDKKKLTIFALIVIWGIYNLAILIKTGFISDDAYNSQVKGAILEQGISINDRILNEAIGWLMGAGRLNVLSWYMTYGIYYLTQDPVTVKIINLTLILSGLLFFYVFSKKETGSSPLALFACLAIPLFYQFRAWHDPILAFTFLMPMIFLLVMIALVLFQYYLDSGKSYLLILSIFIYILVLLMYEISFTLCALFIVVAYGRNRRISTAIRQSLPHISIAVVLLFISLFFRFFIIKNNSYPGAGLHTNLNKFISAFEIQLFSSFPLSYFFFNKENFNLTFQKIDYLIFSFFGLGLSVLIFKVGKIATPFKLSSWMACGFVLLVLPAALTGLSGHQDDLIRIGYGFGYIPVYIQYFGTCIFLVSTLSIVANKIKQNYILAIFSISVSAILTMVAVLNLGLNRAIALNTNQIYKYPSDLLRAALRAGIGDGMKEGAFIFRTMRYPSDHMWFYSTFTNKKLNLCEMSDAIQYKACITKIISPASSPEIPTSNTDIETIDLSKKDAWILSYNFDKKLGEAGQVYFSKVERIVRNAETKTFIQVLVSSIKIYNLKKNSVQEVDFISSSINFLKILENQTLDVSEAQPFDKNSLLASQIDFEWLGKVHGREGTNTNNLRWSSGSAALKLYNLTNKPAAVTITMGLGTPTEKASQMAVNYQNQTETLTLSSSSTVYSRKLIIAPGQTEVLFKSNADPFQNGDPRKIVFGIFNFQLKLDEPTNLNK